VTPRRSAASRTVSGSLDMALADVFIGEWKYPEIID
jgi:hypothetical protein